MFTMSIPGMVQFRLWYEKPWYWSNELLSFAMWVLRMKLSSSAKASIILYHGALSSIVDF